MNQFAETFGLNPNGVRILALTYSGYAEAKQEQLKAKDATTELLIASSYLIGGLFQILIDPREAIAMFSNAADLYFELKMPIWRICQICAGKEIVIQRERQTTLNNNNEHDLFYKELQYQFNHLQSGRVHFTKFQNRLSLQGTIPQINIPYKTILDLFEETTFWANSNAFEHLQGVGNLLLRFNELTDMYRSNEYYWSNLQGQFIPFEPTTIAICLIIVKKWIRSGQKIESLKKNIGLKYDQTILLTIAYELFLKQNSDFSDEV